ncbi:hypothetical protein [Photobacterium angustum]|nr:hypothetical protein [Photobacterium angustum]
MIELFGDISSVVIVKTAILFGAFLLIPLMAITGITGAKMAGNVNKGPIGRKKKRMPLIAFNGVFVLLPCALYLYYLSSNHQFSYTFYIVQIIEFIAGVTNLSLMALNIFDTKKLRSNKAQSA